MKKLFIICLIVSNMIGSIYAYGKGTEQPLDKIIAIVNDDVISRAELNHALDNAKIPAPVSGGLVSVWRFDFWPIFQ